jgi:hydrogenase maturation protease
MRVLVLALGNPILCDDGVAFHVLERMRPHMPESEDLVVDEACTGGIDLLVYVLDFDRVLILDAVKTLKRPPGHVGTYTVDDLEDSIHVDSPHHTNFATAMELGRRLHPDRMPEDIVIVGIEVDNILDFTEDLTPAVDNAVVPASELALEILKDWGIALEANGASRPIQ